MHMHANMLLYTHGSEMSQHQREMCFGCYFQRIEHHKTLKKSISKFTKCYCESLILGDPIKMNLF